MTAEIAGKGKEERGEKKERRRRKRGKEASKQARGIPEAQRKEKRKSAMGLLSKTLAAQSLPL